MRKDLDHPAALPHCQKPTGQTMPSRRGTRRMNRHTRSKPWAAQGRHREAAYGMRRAGDVQRHARHAEPCRNNVEAAYASEL